MWVSTGSGFGFRSLGFGSHGCLCFGGLGELILDLWFCSVMAESKRKRSRKASGGERVKMGEKKKVGPVTVINWDPQKN